MEIYLFKLNIKIIKNVIRTQIQAKNLSKLIEPQNAS